MNVLTVKQKQQGFVSIFSVLIIMSILTLVAIGFSNITRDAQKRTLDNQLNTQAFYAAESGVNDAKRLLTIDPTYTKPDCSLSAGFTATLDATLDTSYTCVLVKLASDLRFDSVSSEGAASPKTGVIESTTGAFGSFDISWNGPDKNSVPIHTPAGLYPNILDTSAAWGGDLGMLRVDLIPIDGALDRNTLVTQSYGFYLYPSTNNIGGPSPDAVKGTLDQAGLIYVKCAAPTSPCKATVNLPSGTSSKYYVRIQSLYNPVSSVDIDNFKSNVGLSLSTRSNQVIIDSTGRTSNVLRRIQVRVRQEGSDSFTSAFAIQSGESICKRMQVAPPDNITPTTTDTPAESACQLNN